jgi:Domain of unknown function (DUF4203)
VSEVGLSAGAGLLVGAALLLFGRRLYWLFVGLAGFLVGFALSTRLFGAEPGWGALAIAVVVGLAAALVAILFQKLAVTLAGFVAGGVLMLRGLAELGHETTGWWWLLVVVAAILGAVITRWLFEAGLIVLSSLLGAALVVESSGLSLASSTEGWAFLGLAALGIVVQAMAARRRRTVPPSKASKAG